MIALIMVPFLYIIKGVQIAFEYAKKGVDVAMRAVKKAKAALNTFEKKISGNLNRLDAKQTKYEEYEDAYWGRVRTAGEAGVRGAFFFCFFQEYFLSHNVFFTPLCSTSCVTRVSGPCAVPHKL